MSTDGLILIDKPTSWTSFDVVAKIRNTLRKELAVELARASHEDGVQERSEQRTEPYKKYGEGVAEILTQQSASNTVGMPGFARKADGVVRKLRVGHTGTLDPLASGLMIVVVGSYCKRASEFSKLDKTYEVTMKLGETSTTGDEEGEKTNVQCPMINDQEIREVLTSFLGESMQIPPAFSAIKVNGKRAYALARAGNKVILEPRKINVTDINLVNYAFPFIDFSVAVSSGTYVRSLVEDIAKKLGTGAYITALRRTKVDDFNIKDAIKIEDVSFAVLRKHP